jgi:hypothetical protein
MTKKYITNKSWNNTSVLFNNDIIIPVWLNSYVEYCLYTLFTSQE